MTQNNDLQQRLLELMKKQEYKPMTVSEIEDAFEMIEAEDFKELVKTLVKNGGTGLCRTLTLQSLWFTRAHELTAWTLYRSR